MNVVGYRVINNKSIVYPRSFCPNCKKTIAYYDLIPIFSWINLKGRCRKCNSPISFLYPFIELITPILFISTILIKSPKYWFGYFIFFTALIIGIRTDIQYMLLPRFTTFYLIFIGYILSYFNLLEITFLDSLLGSFLGYFFLWAIASFFYLLKNKKGLGEGDFELLSAIGAFTGIQGTLYSLFLGSFAGTLFGLIVILKHKANFNTKIAFGPWLSFGAILYIFFKNYLIF